MKKKILIVDDEKALIRMLKINLESTGNFEIEGEDRGSRACETALKFKPDIILMDVIMPDISGDQVAAKIRAHPELCKTPIIFLTATVSRQEAKQCHGMFGGQLFIAKPTTMVEIAEAIQKTLHLDDAA